ncbi:hypothetical protein V8C43DRAFT_55820 [Trichoderma afarasin]
MGNALHVLAVINATPTSNCRWVISAVDCDCTEPMSHALLHVRCHAIIVQYCTVSTCTGFGRAHRDFAPTADLIQPSWDSNDTDMDALLRPQF